MDNCAPLDQVLPSSPGIEPARRQFIEQQFRDLLCSVPHEDALRLIHDAIFVEGVSVSVLHKELSRAARTTRVVAVTSGKGGVGKTTLAVNLAVAFAGLGARVLLFDADLGMANVHVFAGVNPKGTLLDVASGRATVRGILTAGPAGIQIACGASGVGGLANLEESAIASLGQQVAGLSDLFDVVVIDTGAGISAQVMGFLAMAHEIVAVVTPNIAATLDAYGLIKMVREARLPGRLHIVVNQMDDDAQADAVFERLRACAERFLQFSPVSLGSLRRDKSIEEANQARRPLVLAKPRSKNARRVVVMAGRLFHAEPAEVIRRLSGLTSRAISRVHEPAPSKSYECPPDRNFASACQ